MKVSENYEDRVEQFRELFLDSCRLRMRSDVTIGTSLSGGLDSSAVMCAMKYISDKSDDSSFNRDWQHAYVAGFKGSRNDESAFAKQVTDYLGIQSTFLNINNACDLQAQYRQAYMLEELWQNSQIPMMDIYRQERQEGTVVSLDGHGADELFGGYGFDMRFAMMDAATEEEILDIYNTVEGAEELISNNDGKTDVQEKIKRIRNNTRMKHATDDVIRRFLIKSEYPSHQKYKAMGELNARLFMQTHEKILPTLLRNYDRDSMASGVEIRMPFMDYRIVQFAFSIPWKDKIHDGYSKAIIRDALKDIMPEGIVRRRSKIGFNAPLNDWIKQDKDFFLDIVNSKDFAESTIVRNPRKVAADLNKVVTADMHDFHKNQRILNKAWNSINLYFWEKGFFEERGIPQDM